MAARFATETSVSCEKSRAEIETILGRYGAERFGYMTEPERAQIVFHAHNRSVKFTLPLPNREDFRMTPERNLRRDDAETRKHWEQACRQRWRALALVIKAKLEAVECGIAVFEEEFLAHIVLPNGQTVGAWAIPRIAESYATGAPMPTLLESGR